MEVKVYSFYFVEFFSAVNKHTLGVAVCFLSPSPIWQTHETQLIEEHVRTYSVAARSQAEYMGTLKALKEHILPTAFYGRVLH